MIILIMLGCAIGGLIASFGVKYEWDSNQSEK